MQIHYCQNCGLKLSSADELSGNNEYCDKCAPSVKVVLPGSSNATSRKSSATRLPALKAPIPSTERAVRRTPISGVQMPSSTMTPSAPAQVSFTSLAPNGGAGFYFCEKCGKRVTDADIVAGRARNKQVKGIYCELCAEGALTVAFDAITLPEMLKEGERRSDRRSDSARLLVVKPVGDTTHQAKRQRAHHVGVRSFFIMSAIGVIMLFALAVMLLKHTNAEIEPQRSEEQIANKAVPKTNTLAETRIETRPSLPVIAAAEPRKINTEQPTAASNVTSAERDAHARAMLEDAQKSFAADPSTLNVYRGNLKRICSDYGTTPAASDAASILKKLDPDGPTNAQTVTKNAKLPDNTLKTVEQPAKREEKPEFKPAAYALWLKTFQHYWANRDWNGARKSIAEALRSPELKEQGSALKFDQECVALAEMAEDSVPRGAAALLDGRAFILEGIKKKDRFELGKQVKVIKADSSAITLAQDIGGGKITFNLPLSDLSRDTSLALARIALIDNGQNKLALTLLRFSDCLKGGTESDQKFVDLLEQTRKANPPTEPFQRLQAWLTQINREKHAAAALVDLERIANSGKASELRDALRKYTGDYNDTVFFTEHRSELQDFEKRLQSLALQPGLLASYFSGDIDNHRKKFHVSRTVNVLEQDFGTGSPADGVPNVQYDVELSGFVRIANPGEYKFVYIGDDFLEVWLDDKSLGMAQWDRQVTASVKLSAGDHKFKAVHSNNVASGKFSIKWAGPEKRNPEPIPLSALFHIPEEPKP